MSAGPELSRPHAADADELRRCIEAGEWVVDLRDRRAFAAGHLAGSFSFELEGGLATHLGWLIPGGTPLTLLGRTPEQIDRAQRELLRIGIERLAAMAIGGPARWSGGRPLRSYPVADFNDLREARHRRPLVIVDVRRHLEWTASHIDGAIHLPLHELPGRLDQAPAGELWLYCQTGYRASVAASILDAAGRPVVAIDDDYRRAAAADLPIVPDNTPLPWAVLVSWANRPGDQALAEREAGGGRGRGSGLSRPAVCAREGIARAESGIPASSIQSRAADLVPSWGSWCSWALVSGNYGIAAADVTIGPLRRRRSRERGRRRPGGASARAGSGSGFCVA